MADKNIRLRFKHIVITFIFLFFVYFLSFLVLKYSQYEYNTKQDYSPIITSVDKYSVSVAGGAAGSSGFGTSNECVVFFENTGQCQLVWIYYGAKD